MDGENISNDQCCCVGLPSGVHRGGIQLAGGRNYWKVDGKCAVQRRGERAIQRSANGEWAYQWRDRRNTVLQAKGQFWPSNDWNGHALFGRASRRQPTLIGYKI